MNSKNRSIKHLIVLLVCCGLAGSSIGVCVNSAGVFYTPVSDSLGIMRGAFSMHGTISMLATAVISLFVPVIMKRYAYKVILIISVLVAGVSTILMAFSKSVLPFYILGALRGISSGLFAIVPITMIINKWFYKSHGLATSIVLSFSGIAGAVCSPIFSKCIQNFGWEKSYIIMGLVIIGLCIPAIIYPFSLEPKDSGLLAYGQAEEEEELSTDNIVKKKNSFNFFTVSFICFFIFAILHTAVSGITQHLPGFAETLNYTATVGATMLSAGMIGNILSKLVIGFISDRVGSVKATIIMIVTNTIAIFILLTAHSSIALLIGSFLFGSVYSVGAVGFALLTKHFFGVENYSTVYPIISFANNFGGAFALSLVGYIYDFTGSYVYAFIIALVINFTNLILMYIVVKQYSLKKNSKVKEVAVNI